MSIKITEIHAKSIIVKSNLPDADYVINPYVGCSHGCVYCYARFMRRFTGHNEKWGEFTDVKINADLVFPKNTKKYRDKSVFLSSVTDPYNPLEKDYMITRKIIEKLIDIQPNLGIQTKSDLVIRDIDLLRKFKNCSVGMTITSHTNEDAKRLEPNASSIDERIRALQILNDNKINTYVFIGPILPYITDWKKIINKSKRYVQSFMFENANLHGTIWKDVNETIKSKFKHLSRKYDEFNMNRDNFWENEKLKITDHCTMNDIKYKLYFDHKNKRKN